MAKGHQGIKLHLIDTQHTGNALSVQVLGVLPLCWVHFRYRDGTFARGTIKDHTFGEGRLSPTRAARQCLTQ